MPDKLRILVSIPTLAEGKGGAEKTASRLANLLAERGYEVAVAHRKRGDRKPSYPLDESIKVFPINYHQSIDGKVKYFSPDCVIVFYFDTNALWQIRYFKALGRPIVTQECCSPLTAIRNIAKFSPFKELSFSDVFFIRQSIFATVDGMRFVMPSYEKSVLPFMREKAKGFLNYPGKPVPNPSYGQKREKYKILCVGGLKTINKNGVVVAKAFARIAQSHPNWELHFFGLNNFKQEIDKITRRHGLQDRIVDRGIVHEIDQEYLSAEFTVMPSFEEGNPNVVNEAIMHGVPVIGFDDCPGYCGLVTHEKDSLIISRENEVESLASAMDRMMRDRKLRLHLSQGAKETVRNRTPASLDQYYEYWEKLIYDAILKRRSTQKCQRSTHLRGIFEESCDFFEMHQNR